MAHPGILLKIVKNGLVVIYVCNLNGVSARWLVNTTNRASDENRNGVIGRFYSKKTDFNEVTAKDVKKVEAMINNIPVIKFNYKTPDEVYLPKAKVTLIA